MTLEETKKLLMTINAMFPAWKIDNPQETSSAWHWALQDYPAEGIMGALQIYLKTDKSGFAPSVSQLIGCLHEPKQVEQLSEGEAWYLVKQAIRDSGYHAQERFDELPPLVQRAVGGASMLHQWGQTDSDEVNSVIMSNFQRTYRALLSKQEFHDKVPIAVSDLVKQLAEKVTPENRIGVKE